MLVWGDRCGALREAYYPSHERLHPEEAAAALGWHRFALRHRDLFTRGRDTSWFELSDPNAGLLAAGAAPVAPEPAGGCLFVRVRRDDDLVAVSVLDLTGSASGRWDEPSGPPTIGSMTLDVLVDDAGEWRADVAAVGEAGGRFRPAPAELAEHREGRALRVTIPMGDGWSVARFSRAGRSG